MRRRISSLGIVIVALLFWQQGLFSPVQAQDQATTPVPPLFEDVSLQAGITNNRRGTDKSIGQAWGDYDNDGWLDLYVTDTAGPNTLYHNNQDGTFSVSPFNNLVVLPDKESSGAGFVDYDNDGWQDLYVLNWGENVLYHNIGGTGFVDVTDTAEIGGGEANSKTASWGDYDQDGFVDLYVANWACYPLCGRPSTGESDRLYHNNGNGTFSDVTRLLGGMTVGAGFVASFTDYDNDNDLDIYLVNDEFINPIGNVLWRNDGPGCDGWCFVDVAAESGANTKVMGMGLAPADYDNDGDLDFYFSNSGPMSLLQNQGNGTFVDMAQPAGVDMPQGVGWGAVFLDYDNDGWRDLYIAIAEGTGDTSTANPMFHNDGIANGVGTFTEFTTGSAVNNAGHTMGVASGDYNNDGWVDLLVGNYDEGYFLYRNDVGTLTQNRWMAFKLVGGGPVNRDAIGAKVKVTTADGRSQIQEVIAGSSLGAGNSLTLNFGLGSMETADIQIIWPDGLTQSFPGVTANKQYRLGYPINPQVEAAQRLTLYGPQPLQTEQTQATPTFYPSTLQLVLAALVFSFIVVLLVWFWRRQS
ncbi:MAG: CRTAC1 family protein [Candidatus Promineifilaceae bacterium]